MRKILLGTAGIGFAATALLLPAAPASAAAGWGAIAISGNGDLGWALNYDTETEASMAAEDKCDFADCSTVTSFTGCGAVAYSASMNKYSGGYGPTPLEAETSARWYSDSNIVRAAVCND
ncbi:DUF4189 domain-containing protein [Nocardia sp. SYP-A9097]|uniref:DUF4189 domain-containing protein n=1 Tax=Nocardia sp. SYP-A9097 TaxID=2663237 RepID=UPI001890D19B|nr:DUF4189 domain-containing protein [Nocardia sp. SYP-A9097]